jgi:hypothetical protein
MPRIEVSGRLKTYQGGEFSFSYPEEWEVSNGPDQSLIVSDRLGKVGEAVGYGIMVYVVPAQTGRVQLRSDTTAYLKGLTESSPSSKIESEPSLRTLRTRNSGKPTSFSLSIAAPTCWSSSSCLRRLSSRGWKRALKR